MITEDYCSYEVAKLLKEKGFDEPCIRHWDCDDRSLYGYNDIPISNSELQANEYNGYSAPSQSMAMKWLREVHNLSVETFSIKGTSDVCPVFWKSNVVALLTQERTFSGELVYSYEEAVEAALKYSLENLI